MKNFEKLDLQMKAYQQELVENVFLNYQQTIKIATNLGIDFTNSKERILREINENDKISFNDRYNEFLSFQGMMDIFNSNKSILKNPEIVRMQVIAQNYISFTYFNEIIYHSVEKFMQNDSVAKKCINFITTGRVRLFRNAFSHGNWKYKSDYSGLIFYARENKHDTSLKEFHLEDFELGFWQSLSRTINYTLLETIKH
ncbi:hypothetical protein [Leptospira brenneri]|uniref:hypothetical protein n=1 Tax=Leptospira brenneri TaxID=2023182 RepID=UPI000C2A5F00|nr:hypothetical protein [Leptospira brenneri]